MENKSRIIVALDGMLDKEAIELTKKLSPFVAGVKGNDLFDLAAEHTINHLNNTRVGVVFADPKLHDIPTTVSNRMKHFVHMGADWVTVHASGGVEMMAAAVDATKDRRTKVVAVTVLTSTTEERCKEQYGGTPAAKVEQFARMAAEAGVWGIVCSPLEIALVKNLGLRLTIITPGIRPAGTNANDQERLGTPSMAITNGADYLVIGRPITGAENPITAAEAINKEVEAAFAAL